MQYAIGNEIAKTIFKDQYAISNLIAKKKIKLTDPVIPEKT